MSEPTALRTVLASKKLTAPLRDGRLSTPEVRLQFIDIDPVHDAFTPMVNEQPYDLCELAIVTCLQAIERKQPIILLPLVVASRFQRRCLIAYPPRGMPVAAELAGRRIAVRAYTQTTGMWVRAHLTEDYGIATSSIRWLTQKRSHVAGFSDPSFVECVGAEKSLLDMLREGDADAAILGNDLPQGDEFAPVIPQAPERDLAWWKGHGFMPINHVMTAARDVSRCNPDALRAGFELLARAYDLASPADGGPNPLRLGFASLEAPIRWIIEACVEQRLLSRRLSLDEVFGPAQDILERSAA